MAIRRNSNKRLIVEGDADRSFYETCLSINNITDVWVGPPTDFGGGGYGKGNAISLLEQSIDEMNDGTISRLGIIVDSDYQSNCGLGYTKTLEKINLILNSKGYVLHHGLHGGGLFYKSSTGLPLVGVWLMPNCKNDGYLEDFIKSAISSHEQGLLQHVSGIISKLSAPKFSSFHTVKAEICAWLAFQKIPGQKYASTLRQGLVDFNNPQIQAFNTWITNTFN